MKIRPVAVEFYADGQTDVTRLVVAFRNFVNAPENQMVEVLSLFRPPDRTSL